MKSQSKALPLIFLKLSHPALSCIFDVCLGKQMLSPFLRPWQTEAPAGRVELVQTHPVTHSHQVTHVTMWPSGSNLHFLTLYPTVMTSRPIYTLNYNRTLGWLLWFFGIWDGTQSHIHVTHVAYYIHDLNYYDFGVCVYMVCGFGDPGSSFLSLTIVFFAYVYVYMWVSTCMWAWTARMWRSEDIFS